MKLDSITLDSLRLDSLRKTCVNREARFARGDEATTDSLPRRRRVSRWTITHLGTLISTLSSRHRGMATWGILLVLGLGNVLATPACAGAEAPANARPPKNDEDLQQWLENMVWYHRFTTDEIRGATGLEREAIEEALRRFNISQATRPAPKANEPLRVLPYPGGRHPRVGFLEGAIDPQRETKVSVFTPWDSTSYVVVDVPEAIWSNLGLTYLAHTHIDTIWSAEKVALEPLEWTRLPDDSLTCRRVLPNKISFGARVRSGRDAVRMELWLKNQTPRTLSDLRVQNCVMLKGAVGFEQETSKNKLVKKPFIAVRSGSGRRWIITAWLPCDRAWSNPPVPCMHSDPKFPDCKPGEIQRLRGWLSFYEGGDIDAELRRIQEDPWLRGI